MSDFTSKIKGVVDKATSTAKEMAQDATDMKDKLEKSPNQDSNAPSKMEKDHVADEGQYVNVSEFDVSPMSQDPQNLSRSMEQERMGSGVKKEMYDDKDQAEVDSSINDPMYDNQTQGEIGSSMKDETYDSRSRKDGAQSNIPASQCMPESGSAAKRF